MSIQGPRFGGALNEAAEQFSGAYDRKMAPAEFVAEMRKKNQYIMGIGHRVKVYLKIKNDISL